MKKILSFFLFIFIPFVGINTVSASTVSLEQIADRLNSSNYGTYFMEDAYGFSETMIMNIQATVSGNNLIINSTLAPQSTPTEVTESNVTWKLNGNVLSVTLNMFEGADTEDFNSIMYILINSASLMSVVDTIGQLNGYTKGELVERLDILESDEALSLTIDNNGIEFTIPNDNTIHVKIDLDKRLDITQQSTTNTTTTATTTTKNITPLSNPPTGSANLNILIIANILILSVSCYLIINKNGKFKKL